MIRDQYLKGNLSLTITDADFTKRGWYTCQCDKKDLCDVWLQIQRLNSTVQQRPVQSLVLHLDLSDPVKVIYNSTGAANRSSGQICTMAGRSLECIPEYKGRVSAALQLSGMKPSDNGVYIIMATGNEEVIRTYSVTVQAGDCGQKSRILSFSRTDGVCPWVSHAVLHFCSWYPDVTDHYIHCWCPAICGHTYRSGLGFCTDCCTCSCDCGIGCGAYAAEERKSAAPDVIWPVITQRSVTRMSEKKEERSAVLMGCVCMGQSCSPALCALIFFTFRFTTGSEAAVSSVKVDLHDSATLPCSERCSGLVRWTVYHKPTDTLAECDQTSCRPVKEGYQMIHDQYLKENLSLTIADADYSKGNMYTCICDCKALCNVDLLIKRADSGCPVLKVNHHDSVTLQSPNRCSGVVTWIMVHQSIITVAECDQTSCRSKEGYQMSHDQYLKGDQSLTITDADFTKRGLYTFKCDHQDLYDVQLQIEPLKTQYQRKPGESIVMDLDISDPVEVHFNSTGAAKHSSGQICTVDGQQLQCKPEYQHRPVLTCHLELRKMNLSDSGVYTIWDPLSKEVIHTYTVTVQDHQPDLDSGQPVVEPVWVFLVLGVMVVLLIAALLQIVVFIITKQELQLVYNENLQLNRL
ncbi:hypothetical protein AOLI_G00273860 [Acnodon oligacanthus]